MASGMGATGQGVTTMNCQNELLVTS